MREIKFRGYNGNEMVYIDLLEADFKINYLENLRIFAKAGLLMQYTGLKDENGIDIYEGDIVSDKEFKYIVEFKYEYNSFGASGWVGVPINSLDAKLRFTHLNIIGNIYENPELLEKKLDDNR